MRVEAEKSLAEMADSLDRMLGTMFPKHALCHMLRHDQVGEVVGLAGEGASAGVHRAPALAAASRRA